MTFLLVSVVRSRRSGLVNGFIRVSVIFVLVLTSLSVCHGKDSWRRVRSKNFVLVGSAGEKTIRDVASRLEQFRAAVRLVLPTEAVDSQTPTTVVIFKDDKAYEPFKPLYQGKTSDVSGYFQKGEDMNYITMSTSLSATDRYRIIYHEFAHQLIYAVSDSFPVWFNEGMAEYYSTFQVMNDGKKVYLGRAVGDHVQLLRTTRLLPFELLFKTEHNSRLYNETEHKGVFYAQSWAFVHYCLLANDRQRRPQLIKFLNLAVDGSVGVDEQFRQAFGTDYKTLSKELESYLRNSRFPAEVLQLDSRLEFEKEMRTEALSDSEIAFYLGDLLLHLDRQREAESHLRNSLSLDPVNSNARAALGMLRLRQNRAAEARKELEQAVADPNVNPIAHYYYAYVLSRSEGPSVTALAHLKKSIQEMPGFAEAYNLLAFINLMNNEDLDESIKLVRQGIAIAPARKGFALTLAQLQLRKGDYEAAMQTIETLRRGTCDEHTKEVAEQVAFQIEQMRRFAQQERIVARRAVTESETGGTLPRAIRRDTNSSRVKTHPDPAPAPAEPMPEEESEAEAASPPSPPPPPPPPPKPAKSRLVSTTVGGRPACSPPFADLRGLSKVSGTLVRVDAAGNQAVAFVVLVGDEEFQFLGPKAGIRVLFSCRTRLGPNVDYAKLQKSSAIVYFIPDDDSPRFAGTAIAIEIGGPY